MTVDQQVVQVLLSEEIDRIVEDATSTADVVAVARCADRLQTAFPNSGMSANDIADRLAMAAVAAGLAVELNRREPVA